VVGLGATAGFAGCSAKEVDGELGVAKLGDLCKVDGTYACAGGNQELVCKDGEFTASQSCEGGCEITEDPDTPLLVCYDADGHEK
jgi:hypothetical protein